MDAVQREPDLSKLDVILSKGENKGLIQVLQQAQDEYGYLPREVLRGVAQKMRMPLNRVYGVATFYSQFYLTRRGRIVIKMCDGTACHVKGAAKSIDYLKREKGLEPGTTSPDYEYTLNVVYCLGACALAPTAYVNDRIITQATEEKLRQALS